MTASKTASAPIRAAEILPLFATVLAGWSVDASAQSRFVFINGVRMSDGQVAALAQRAGPDGATNLDGTHGPYPTMRRAEEVANGYRQRGLRAASFHNGDGFYVRVSR